MGQEKVRAFLVRRVILAKAKRLGERTHGSFRVRDGGKMTFVILCPSAHMPVFIWSIPHAFATLCLTKMKDV